MVGESSFRDSERGARILASHSLIGARFRAGIARGPSRLPMSRLLRLVLTSQDAGESGDRERRQDQPYQHLGHVEQIEESADCDGQLLLAVPLGPGKRQLGERQIARARTPMLLVAQIDEREEDVERIGDWRETGILLLGALVVLA